MEKSVKQMVEEIMEKPREQTVEKLMRGFSQVITGDQYRKLEQALLTMPDDAFAQMTEDSIRFVQQKKPTVAEHFNLGWKLRERFKVNTGNSALNNIPAEFLSPEENEELWNAINRTHPSDTIRMKKAEDLALCERWRKKSSQTGGMIPSDLFFTGKIRFMDCYIIVDETADDNGLEVKYRVVVLPDYQDRIKDAGGEPVYVGAIVLEPMDFALFFPLKVCEGIDSVIAGAVGYHDIPENLFTHFKEKWTQMYVLKMGSEFLSTWYGIQTLAKLRKA